MFVLRGVDHVVKNVVEMNHPLLVYNTAVSWVVVEEYAMNEEFDDYYSRRKNRITTVVVFNETHIN